MSTNGDPPTTKSSLAVTGPDADDEQQHQHQQQHLHVDTEIPPASPDSVSSALSPPPSSRKSVKFNETPFESPVDASAGAEQDAVADTSDADDIGSFQSDDEELRNAVQYDVDEPQSEDVEIVEEQGEQQQQQPDDGIGDESPASPAHPVAQLESADDDDNDSDVMREEEQSFQSDELEASDIAAAAEEELPVSEQVEELLDIPERNMASPSTAIGRGGGGGGSPKSKQSASRMEENAFGSLREVDPTAVVGLRLGSSPSVATQSVGGSTATPRNFGSGEFQADEFGGGGSSHHTRTRSAERRRELDLRRTTHRRRLDDDAAGRSGDDDDDDASDGGVYVEDMCTQTSARRVAKTNDNNDEQQQQQLSQQEVYEQIWFHSRRSPTRRVELTASSIIVSHSCSHCGEQDTVEIARDVVTKKLAEEEEHKNGKQQQQQQPTRRAGPLPSLSPKPGGKPTVSGAMQKFSQQQQLFHQDMAHKIQEQQKLHERRQAARQMGQRFTLRSHSPPSSASPSPSPSPEMNRPQQPRHQSPSSLGAEPRTKQQQQQQQQPPRPKISSTALAFLQMPTSTGRSRREIVLAEAAQREKSASLNVKKNSNNNLSSVNSATGSTNSSSQPRQHSPYQTAATSPPSSVQRSATAPPSSSATAPSLSAGRQPKNYADHKTKPASSSSITSLSPGAIRTPRRHVSPSLTQQARNAITHAHVTSSATSQSGFRSRARVPEPSCGECSAVFAPGSGARFCTECGRKREWLN